MEEQLAWMLIFRTKMPTGKREKKKKTLSPFTVSFLPLQLAWKNWLQCVINHLFLTNKSWLLLVLAWSALQRTPRHLMRVRLASLRDRLDFRTSELE